MTSTRHPETSFTTVRGHRVAYRVSGAGRDVLVSPGDRRRRTAIVAGLALCVASARPVAAADFCTRLGTLIDQAPSGFAGITAPSNGGSGAGRVTLELAGAERCAVTSQLEGKSYHCVWKYPYRSEAASAAFAELARAIRRCVGGDASVRDDPRVNHPDSYDLRVYELDRATVSVSVKDKVALDGTFLFIRVSP